MGRQPGQERTLVAALRLRSALSGTGVDTVREAVEVATRLGDADLARDLLARFVESRKAAPGNVSETVWALRELSRLHEASGDLRRAVELKREAAKVSEPDEARLLRLEVAAIAADKLEDLALAAEVYEVVRAADPVDREAWEPLVAVYRRMGDHAKLADLLATVVAYVEDAPERAKLRFERVRTMTEHLGMSDDDAASELREIVDEDPGLADAALALGAILERTGKTGDLVELLSRQLDAARDAGSASGVATLALKLGSLVQESDRARARDVYYTGIDWEPKNRALLDALLDLTRLGGRRRGAGGGAREEARGRGGARRREDGPGAARPAPRGGCMRRRRRGRSRSASGPTRARPRCARSSRRPTERAPSGGSSPSSTRSMPAGSRTSAARVTRWREASWILRDKGPRRGGGRRRSLKQAQVE